MRHRSSAVRERTTRRDALLRAKMRSRRGPQHYASSRTDRRPPWRPVPYAGPAHCPELPRRPEIPCHPELVPHIEPSLPPPDPGTVPRPDAPGRVQPPGPGPAVAPPGINPPGVSPPAVSPPAVNPPGASPSGDSAQPQPEEPSQSLDRYGALQLPVPGKGSNIHCLTIIGQIEGHLVLPPQNKTTKYEHTIPQLVAIELNPAIEGLLVILNTVGGDVEAGLAIAEMVASLSKPKVSLVVGGGHSIGVPIAVAADRSFITHTATMTIHPIRLSGLVVGVPQTYEYLDKMQDRVVKFIVANSHISEACFRELMFRTGELARDIGTVLVGHDAVRIGLVDAVGGLEEAIAELKGLIEARRRTGSAGARSDAARQGGERPLAPGRPTLPGREDETGHPAHYAYDAQTGPGHDRADPQRGEGPGEAAECPWRPGGVQPCSGR